MQSQQALEHDPEQRGTGDAECPARALAGGGRGPAAKDVLLGGRDAGAARAVGGRGHGVQVAGGDPPPQLDPRRHGSEGILRIDLARRLCRLAVLALVQERFGQDHADVGAARAAGQHERVLALGRTQGAARPQGAGEHEAHVRRRLGNTPLDLRHHRLGVHAGRQQRGPVGRDGADEARIGVQAPFEQPAGGVGPSPVGMEVGHGQQGQVGASSDAGAVARGGVAHVQARLPAGEGLLLAPEPGQRPALGEHEVGEVREHLEPEISALEGVLIAPSGVQGADQAHEQRRNEASALLAADLDEFPCALELDHRRARLADGGVLEPEVEVQKRVGRALGALGLQQLDVPARLGLRIPDGAEVAIVLDPDWAVLDPLGQVGGQPVRDLLVQPALEAVLRAVAEHPQRVVDDAGAIAFGARVAGFEQVEGLAPDVAGERAELGRIAVDEHLVGVEVDDPVAGGGVERDVAGLGEGARPFPFDDARPEGPGDLDRAVLGAGVHDDDLVHRGGGGGQAAAEHLLLIADDHAQAERQPGGRNGSGGQALGALGQGGQSGVQGTRRGARGGKLLRTAGHLGHVAFEMGKVRVKPRRRLEQRAGGVETPELIEGHAGVVEKSRLARLGLEYLH